MSEQQTIKRYDVGNGGAQHCYGCFCMKEDDLGDYVAYEDYAALQQRIATLEAACEASARWYKFFKRGFPIATPQAEELMVHYLRAAGYLK